MNSLNIKKTITAFLILAALTSSLVFVLSNSLLDRAGLVPNTKPERITLDGKSAFVEPLAGLSNYNSPILARSDINLPYSGNVTDYFADQIGTGLIAANPNGPKLKTGGAAALAMPKDFGSFDLSALVPANFDVPVDQGRVKSTKNYTADDILTYLQNSQDAIQNTLVPGIKGLGKQSSSGADSLASILSIYDQTENQIYGAPVPAPLADYNSSLLKFVGAQRIFFDQNDPAKALIALKNPALVLSPYKQALDQQIKNVQKNLPSILAEAKTEGNKTALQSAINGVLGIQEAYAFSDFIGGVSGILNAITDWLSTALTDIQVFLDEYQWVEKLLTELLKNVLIAKLVSQVLNWVQGGGTPQFVSNWKGFLGDAANVAAGGVIQQFAPGLCQSFQPLIKLSLSPPPKVALSVDPTNNAYTCTLDKVVGNVQDYAKSFQNGGWVAYGELLKPQNNFFSAYMDLSDQQMIAAAAAQEAAKNEAVSAAGYKSQKQCDSTRTVDNGYPVDISQFSSDPTFQGPDKSSCDADGIHCSRLIFCDSQGITTPGSVVDSTVKQNLGSSPMERIVNAQDLTGLLDALVDAGLSKLIAAGQKGLMSLTSSVLAQKGSLADTCAQYGSASSTAYQNCVAQNNGINTVVASQGSSKDAALKKIKNIYDLKTQTAVAASDALSKASLAKIQFDIASSTCAATLASSTTVDAADTLGFIITNSAITNQKISDLNYIINNLNGNPDATSSDERAGMLVKLDGYVKLLEQDKIRGADGLAAALSIAIASTSDAHADLESFYNALSISMDNSGSVFGKLFGTLSGVGNQLGDVKSYAATVTQPAGCGLLEKARGIYNLKISGNPACSIAAVNVACRSSNPP